MESEIFSAGQCRPNKIRTAIDAGERGEMRRAATTNERFDPVILRPAELPPGG
jgi:hypothetical protein